MNKSFLLFILSFSFASFSQNTYVPDNAFEGYLISEGFDIGPLDDSVPTQNMHNVIIIDLTWSQVASFTGIEDCINLTTLSCYISTNLTSLDLSNNSALTFLDCSATGISTLDISQNINLQNLACVDNNLTSLDLSQNPILTSLQCAENQITSLDLSNNVQLTNLYCSNNLITGLDLSIHPNLIEIECGNNNLSSLKVNNGNNHNVSNSNFYAMNNPDLQCIVVDSSNWSDLNWSYIDSQTSFNDTCYYLSTDKESLEINLYPNPVSTYFIVESNENTNFKIVNLNGQVIKSGHLFTGKNTLFVEKLNAGIYLLFLESDDFETVKKISVL